jgi:hypothetical protein
MTRRVPPSQDGPVVLPRPAAERQSTNGVIRELVYALRLLSAGVPGSAVALLELATTRPVGPLHLTDREYAEVLGWCGITERTCRNCGRRLEFVGDGPDPGWWRHQDSVSDCRGGAVPAVAR